MDSGPSTSLLSQAAAAIEEGSCLIKPRQKAICMADRLEFGWSVVTEYDTDELADNSDDECKIEKAEKAAERKAAVQKKRRGKLPGCVRVNKVEPPHFTGHRELPVPPSATLPVTAARIVPHSGVGTCFYLGS